MCLNNSRPSFLTCLYPCLHHFNNANIFETRNTVCLGESVSHLTSQLLVLLHQFLVFLVDGQHFTDTVGSRLSLEEDHHSTFYTFPLFYWCFALSNHEFINSEH